ncbi:MAG: glutathione S-transferase family protein [Candidatus Binatia bacterium]|nr:glutathione S-transferase family protein [Candidatus Binatia bacterium]
MKLYTYPDAPNPRRVHIYLAEKGIEVPCEKVDITKRENRQPEFIERVNIMGGLPVLELDDGSHIAESIAICRYFEALHPDKPLFGAAPRDQARTEMWLRRIELNFMMPVGMVWVHGSPLTATIIKNQIPEVADQNREVVKRYFAFLNEQLATREFIAGDKYSIADIVALCTYDFAGYLNAMHPEEEHANLRAWHQRVSGRPSAAA